MNSSADATKANSIGLALADTEWLDNHFLAMQPEYEDMLRWVGLQPGWKVLDAGCGSGSFLPLMTDLVGPSGEVHALDLDPKILDVVRARAKDWAAPVITRVGDILATPFDAHHFDAAWCANCSQYLSDAETRTLIHELKRVVRPGGLVAIKEYDPTGLLHLPAPPTLWLRFVTAWAGSDYQQGHANNRTPLLASWLRAAGLIDICQKPTLMVRFQPLRAVERRHQRDLLRFWADCASRVSLPEEDRVVWRALADVDAPGHILNDPDYQYRTIQTVFVGRVPNGA